MALNNEAPIVTYVACAITLIAAIGGMVVVILGSSGALSFEEYLNLMTKFVFGLGLLGIGRGVSAGLKAHKPEQPPADPPVETHV